MSTDFYPLVIKQVDKLTGDAISITFSIKEKQKELFRYIQGQHITLKADIDGEDIRRSYSICQSAQSQTIQVGIKAIENGVFSNYAIQNFKPGMILDVMPPQGHFYSTLDRSNQKQYLLIAVGSGITPILSHLESILETEPQSQVTLLYGNQRTSLMMFRERLSFLKNKYLSRMVWYNFFTKEENDASLLNGRISPQKLIDLNDARMLAIDAVNDVFICGPEEMTLSIAKSFEHWGFEKERIHYELFFSGSAEKQAKKSQNERAEKFGDKKASVSIKVAGRKTLIDLEMGGQTILDAALDAGADLPYSCKGGVCATCKAQVISGDVEMDMNHSLTDQEVADGMVLTCQAHPTSDKVEVDFDVAG